MEQRILVPDKHIEIVCPVTELDKKASPFLEVPIQLPADVTRLDVEYEYAKADDCVIDIGILDSCATDYPTRSGFRGWSGGARSAFFVATDAATPGYVAGLIPEGQWKIILGLYKIPPQGVSVTLKIKADTTSRGVYTSASATSPRKAKPDWYRGDLHCHTYHSDAKGSPETLAENARLQGLDFLAVTDHNTVSQWQYFSQKSSEQLVFIPGMEVTTYRGHANIYGLTDWIDFRLGGNSDLSALVDETQRQGALLSVNHDKEPLPWNYAYPPMDCLEVFHGHWLTGNDRVLKLYDRFLAEGHRITLIGGSDYHQPVELQPPGPFGLGKPSTVLWLPQLDAASVINGLRSGNCFVTESPTGPDISFTANGHTMGSYIRAEEVIEIVVNVKRAAGDRLVWVSENGSIAEMVIPENDWKKTFTTAAPEKFLRAEIVAVRSKDRLIEELVDWYKGKTELHRAQQSLNSPPTIRRALSNPVYFQQI